MDPVRLKGFVHDFNQHKINLHSQSTLTTKEGGLLPLEILDLKIPGTVVRRITYTLLGNTLHVQGDWGHASYWWSEVHDLAWVADTPFDYFHGKCRSSFIGDDFTAWNATEAWQKFTQHIDSQIKEGGYSRDDALINCMNIFEEMGAYNQCQTQDAWCSWIRTASMTLDGDHLGSDIEKNTEVLSKYLHEGFLFGLESIGIAPHHYSAVHWAGLKWWDAQRKEGNTDG